MKPNCANSDIYLDLARGMVGDNLGSVCNIYIYIYPFLGSRDRIGSHCLKFLMGSSLALRHLRIMFQLSTQFGFVPRPARRDPTLFVYIITKLKSLILRCLPTPLLFGGGALPKAAKTPLLFGGGALPKVQLAFGEALRFPQLAFRCRQRFPQLAFQETSRFPQLPYSAFARII